jgi:hypothetical protein
MANRGSRVWRRRQFDSPAQWEMRHASVPNAGFVRQRNSLASSGVAKSEFTRPRWLCVAQMFNHQTHHRGQATTLLKQAGIDPGITDLPWAPLARDASGRIVLGDDYAL